MSRRKNKEIQLELFLRVIGGPTYRYVKHRGYSVEKYPRSIFKMCDVSVVCEYVCVCNLCLIDFNYIPHYSCRQLSMSSGPLHYPSYTPNTMSTLLYADYHTSPHPIHWPRPIPFPPEVSPRFNPAKARAVTSLPHPSAQVAAGCAPLCLEGRGGAGC